MEEVAAGAVARLGRRPGPASTRQAVLDSARARFARDGFARTTIRGIAADAGVDPSQVIQFFRAKDQLFAAVMAVPASALQRFDAAFAGPEEDLGSRVVRAYLTSWEDVVAERDPLMAMLRGAVVHEAAAEQLRDFVQSRLLNGMHDGGDDAVLRAGLAASMLVGVTVGRRILGVPALADAETETLIRTLAPAIQLVLAPHGRSIGCP